ncbi:uncharacterized protein LOC111326374 isoform X1 [Stylophora pistillata]|uniref:uncharacterized protein LOC111326374 isoform X1 n=2 Tax=Stylophora pistillata TaxID=50429 RepID=UPI000C047186|nr:uncharacterized protein LOC111326374 isoform X1 [Stylophora pistillata]
MLLYLHDWLTQTRVVTISVFKRTSKNKVGSLKKAKSISFEESAETYNSDQLSCLSRINIKYKMAQGSSETSNQTNRGRGAQDPRLAQFKKKVVTLLQCMSIQEEAGECWMHLGANLKIPDSELSNIGADHQRNAEKGLAVLQSWRNRKGRDATVGCLYDAFKAAGKKKSAEKVLELCKPKP